MKYFSADKKICLNRGKLGKDLFKRKIVQSLQIERRNLNRLLKSANADEILCDDGKKYQTDDLCRGRESLQPKFCYISEIGLEIDLYVYYYIQFSFSHQKFQCIKK